MTSGRRSPLRWILFVAAIAVVGATSRVVPALDMFADITTNTVTDFATYTPCPVNVTPCASTYTIAADFSNVVNFSDFTFTTAQKNLLRQNGFVVVPKALPYYSWSYPPGEMYDIYNYARDKNLPIFVTVDALLHTYHELYDFALRTIETKRFLNDLDRLTTTLIAASRTQYNQATDARIKQAALSNVAYLSIAAKLLSTTATIPADVTATVTAELALINAHAAVSRSPVFGYQEDYTQYVPRGHYTLSPELERYFRAMMWFGRMAFHSEPVAFAGVTQAMADQETRRALLITQLIYKTSVTTETALAVWERIYLPTTFFVGKADDLTIYKYAELARPIFGANLAAVPVNNFGNDTSLTAFLNQVAALPPPQIATDAWGKGFRFMGQRFIPDSYMFQELVMPKVGGRTMPRGLDVMAVLGSQRAYQILDQLYHETTYTSYTAQVNKLKAEFTAMDDSVWAQNLYWNWLYCLMPMLVPKGAGFPTYMQSAAWLDKDLACALGSWAELRHDTLLYAKQNISLGSSVQAYRDAFVEANPWAFARMAALTRLMLDGLSRQGLLLDDFAGQLTDLEQLLLSLKGLAEKELANQPFTITECFLIRMIGKRLVNLTRFNMTYDYDTHRDDDMAVIADVGSDFTSGECLEVGVGRPFTLYVVNKTENQLAIALGAAYSYYEFHQPLSSRLTDEDWKQRLSSATPPILPGWMRSYMDLSASLNLGAPANTHDPQGDPNWTGTSMTVVISPVSPFLRTRYAVTARVNYYGQYTSFTLEAIAGSHRQNVLLPLCKGSMSSTKEYQGVLDLQGWPAGLVSLTIYSPRSLGMFKTTSFLYSAPTAVPRRQWELYY